MALTPEQNLAYLEQIAARAALGAAAAANAMARYVADRVASDTLNRGSHAPGMYHKAKPGAPPMRSSGALARGMYWTPASGGLRATAAAGNRDKRARVFEYGGCVLRPTRERLMTWRDSRGWWSHPRLPLEGEYPEHPFLGPTTDEAIDDGELRRVAVDAFREYDP